MKYGWVPADEIKKYWRISYDFMLHVLDSNPSETFISDRSSLYEFAILSDSEGLKRQIFLRDGIEVNDLDGLLLVDICRRIVEEWIFSYSPGPS